MAVIKDLQVDQGADYVRHFLVESDGNPIDFVGDDYRARFQVKPSYESAVTLLFFDSDGVPGGGLTFHENGVQGRVTLRITAEQTNALIIPGEELVCVYDFELVNASGFVYRIYQGEITFSKNITTNE